MIARLPLFLVLLSAVSAAAQGRPDLLSVSLGTFDAGEEQNAPFLGLEYRAERYRLGPAVPFVTSFINYDGGGYAGFGVAFPFRLAHDRLGFSLFTGFGGYWRGSSKDLGGAAEFRSGAELSYIFAGEQHLGLGIDHISNAGLYDRNPGSNQLSLRYSVPLR